MKLSVLLFLLLFFKPLVGESIIPWATLSTYTLLISPNFDRKDDFLTINQDGSSEDLWIGEFRNSKGDIVRSFKWEGLPKGFKWDGRSEYNRVVIDGEYSYLLGFMKNDKFQVVSVIENIMVDSTAPLISIEGKKRYGIDDNPNFILKIPIKERVLDKAVIISSSNFEPTPYSSNLWDSLPDGSYTITLKVKYRNQYVAIDSFITSVRRTKPEIGVVFKKDIEYFSYLGIGHIEGFLKVSNLKDSNIENITLNVRNNLSIVYTMDVIEALNSELFIGIDNIVGGKYQFELVSMDDFGNSYKTSTNYNFNFKLFKIGDYFSTNLNPIEFKPYEYETDFDLSDYIEILNRYKKREIYLISNAFNDGSDREFLSRLCSQRGNFIKRQLIKKGISRDRIVLINNNLKESNRLTYIYLK